MAGLTLNALSKSFGKGADLPAVSDLNLIIRNNQFITLLGPSGCGKTTTLRLIAGYLTPDTGTIHVDGKLISSSASVVPPEHRGMGMVFQNYAVWPHKTVFENVVFGLRVRKVPNAKAREMVEATLALVNLSGFENRLPNELSGGQQQRVALARSLVVEPEILLLDEPLSNLDAKLRERMRIELKQLQRRTGITFVYVTHDQAEALALSDQIAVIDHGRLQQYGTPQEVYSRPANRVVADFMGHVNVLPGKVAAGANGRGLLLVGDMRIEASLPDGTKAGDEVDIVVRPEDVIVGKPGEGIEGEIRDYVFLGNLSEYEIKLKSGQLIRVQAHPKSRFAAGAKVGIALDSAQVSVFRKPQDRSTSK